MATGLAAAATEGAGGLGGGGGHHSCGGESCVAVCARVVCLPYRESGLDGEE